MIQTKEFGLSKNEYFKISVQVGIRKTWWLFVIMGLLTIYAYFDFEDPVSKFMFFFGILYFPLYLLNVYYITHSNENKLILSPRVLTITPVKISALFGGAAASDTPTICEFPADCITRTVILKKYWILYISKASFVVIPKNVFYSEEDIAEFKSMFFKEHAGTVLEK